MEHQIIQRLVQYLLLSGFPSKKAIAQQMGIPYRTLLNACDQESSLRIKAKATEQIIRYCIRQRIALVNAIDV